MSEDVTAVSMQVSEKAAEAALSAFKSVLDSVGRLFRELLGMEHDRARARAQMKAAKGGSQTPEKTKPPNVSATNLTGIKPGEVSLKDLAENARNTGEALSVAQNGFSQEDRKAIARTAKKYGIPVAFSNTKGKNNLYANVRSGYLPIFKQICTECIKEKIAAQPETLGNFKVQPWEVPHLTAMLKAHDLPAVFVETKSGDQFCLHDVKHQDAVRIVREEFVAKCKEIEKQFSFDKDENGFYTLKDLHSGREVSFDQIPDVLFQATKGDCDKDDFWSQKGQTVLLALMFLLIEQSEYNAIFDENGKIIPGTRDETNLNFYAITEKMRGLQYPPQGSQKPDGFFLTQNPGESDEAFADRQEKGFLCPLDREFLELQRRKPDTLAYRLYKEIRNAPEETGQSLLSPERLESEFTLHSCRMTIPFALNSSLMIQTRLCMTKQSIRMRICIGLSLPVELSLRLMERSGNSLRSSQQDMAYMKLLFFAGYYSIEQCNRLLEYQGIRKTLIEISQIDINDGVVFEFQSAEPIMEEHDYPGIRFGINALFEGTKQHFAIDISTDDIITPDVVAFAYPQMFEERTIPLLAYNLETLLAEKMESILSRGTANTRIQDFYADGRRDASDVTALRNWLSGEPEPDVINPGAADLNRDGRLNAADLTLLKRMLVNT